MSGNVRPESMQRITTPELAEAFINEQVAALKAQIGDKKVLLALSGGVDSSVVAALLIKAVGKQLVCVHVNHGLLRKGEPEQVIKVFRDQLGARPSCMASWVQSAKPTVRKPSVRMRSFPNARSRSSESSENRLPTQYIIYCAAVPRERKQKTNPPRNAWIAAQGLQRISTIETTAATTDTV